MSVPPPKQQWLTLVLIGLGGVAGALLRYSLGVLMPTTAGHWPLDILLANSLGCLLMGIFLGIVTHLPQTPPKLTPLIATGFLGGLTTFSSFAEDTILLAETGAVLAAALYTLTTLLVGWLCLRLGWFGGHRGGSRIFTPAEMGD